MRVLIVDDEPPARVRLAHLLAAEPDVEVVGHGDDAASALAQVHALAPDVVFLDVQMPGPSGLDVAASLPDPAPAIVFVTAHDRYALPAFEAAATDYLLKPVEPARLRNTLQRLRLHMAARRATKTVMPATQLVIADGGRVHVILVSEILWLQSADNYVVVHTATGSPLMRRTLKGLLINLGPGFQQTHRGAAVALAHVRQVTPGGTDAPGDATVLLRDGQRAPCSRRFRTALLASLHDNHAP